MASGVRVGIMGAGSIGCFLGARLAIAGETDQVFIGRERSRDELAEYGLSVRDFGRQTCVAPADGYSVETDVEALRDCQVVLCCVKSAQTEEVAKSMATVLPGDTVVVSMQNGVRNAERLRQHLGARTVVAGIVDFNVVSQGKGLFQRTTSGPLKMEACADRSWQTTAEALRHGGIPVDELQDLAPSQWTKLLVNLNNAVSALSGAPTRDLLVVPHYRKVVAAVVGEGVAVLRKAGIQPARLRGVPVAWMPKVLSLPSPIVRLVTRAQMKIDPEARSSMWEDLSRGRATEIDYLNGEIVRLASELGIDAPVNARIIELIRDAERAAKGPPNMSGPELWAALRSAR